MGPYFDYFFRRPHTMIKSALIFLSYLSLRGVLSASEKRGTRKRAEAAQLRHLEKLAIPPIRTLITEDERARNRWGKGSQLMVWSERNQKWYQGEVSKVYYFNENKDKKNMKEDRLRVKYRSVDFKE